MSGHTQPPSSNSERSSDDASPTSPNSVLGKMILPRLSGSFYEPSLLPKRTAHACERCRALKAKCTGGQRCEKCVIDKADCRYGDGKRERNKKEMASQVERTSSLAVQNEQLLATIREIANDPNFSANRHPLVIELLSKYPVEDTSPKAIGSRSEGRHHVRAASNYDGEEVTSARIDLSGVMARPVPLTSLGIGSGASGYIGKSSEICWLQCALEHMSLQAGDFDHVLSELKENHPQGSPLDYHMDEADLLAVDEESVDPMEVPPLPIATILAEAFFDTVHSSFPLIDKDAFMAVLVRRAHRQPPLSWEGRRWLSMANIIFAIGAKWMYLTRPLETGVQEFNVGPGDHIVYYARARSLGLDHRLIMDHPLLEQIQALGVLGVYLIVNHQISRAWTTIGHAIRHAIALGLHPLAGAGIGIGQQHVHARTWWSLYSLEQLLGDFTGRPTSILDNDVAMPLEGIRENRVGSQSPRQSPTGTGVQPFSPGPARPALDVLPYSPHLYFACRVRLSIIGHKIRSSLYSSTSAHGAWSQFQHSVRELDRELTQWSADLPAAMEIPQRNDFHSSAPHGGGVLLSRYELAMSYQSARMILFRPCLCPLVGSTYNDPASSHNFNQHAAVSCISAARNLLALLPDEASTFHASKMLPCWSLLHYITQAGAILMLELSLKAEHMPTQVAQLVKDMEKVLNWVAEMAADSLSAWRSWTIFHKLSLQAAAGVGADINVPEDVQKPPGWKPAYEQLFPQTLNVRPDQLPHLQNLDRVHHQPEIAPVPTSNTLFPVDAEISGSSWHMSPTMSHSTTNLTYSERPVYPPPGGESAGEMDWSA